MLPNHHDARISGLIPLITPAQLLAMHPATEQAIQTTALARTQIEAILLGRNSRLFVVLGPCSIHDPAAALDYGKKLKAIIPLYEQQLCLIMRVYFEKPRTTIGWKGLINDPHLDNSCAINEGLHIARQLLIDLAHEGIPTATEFLDTISPRYIHDLIAWGAIGARTTESQLHRALASGLSMPIGFKNGTNGNIQIAIDAIHAAAHPHHFLGTTPHGEAAIVSTRGNPMCHIILRGSQAGPNYSKEHINAVAQLTPSMMIDCSHGNCEKDYLKQIEVATTLCEYIASGNTYIKAVMLESHLQEGKQTLDKKDMLVYGQSITDACLSWEQTLPILDALAKAVDQRASNHSYTSLK